MASTVFRLERLETDPGPVALVRMECEAVPVLGRQALESLLEVLDKLESADWAAMVLTGSAAGFCAGADIDELTKLETREQAIAGSRAGHELFGRIRGLPFPTVAAINGTCLGGGVEIALHCDYRVIASDVRRFAFPECLLGIVPAWGGTQLAPRLVGTEPAAKLVVLNPMRQNRMLKAEQAHELGFADRIADPDRLMDEAFALADAQPQREEADLSNTNEVVGRTLAELDETVHAATPAPYAALELIEGAARWSLEEGLRKEEEFLVDLLFMRHAEASLYSFHLVQRRRTRRPEAEPRAVEKIGIVGAGLMATQLATLFLKRLGLPLVLRDLEQAIVDRALATIRADADGRVRGTTRIDDLQGCDFVLEAVFEDLAVKRQVFAELREIAPDAVLATNTSALSVAEMGADVGMHFFNPVALLPLVEVVRTPTAPDDALATAWDLAKKLRKRPLLVEDAPGFVVNRLLARMMVVIQSASESGNTVEETDEAVLSLGMPMAPSVLLELVGRQVAAHAVGTLRAAYPDRFSTEPAGRRSREEIRDAVLEAMADEARHILEERVVPEAADVDTAMLLGAGFPFWLGGITKYLDQTGVSERVVGRPLAEL